MNRTLNKLMFFATLYFLQGAVFAYVVNFQKPFLAGLGVSKQTLGIFTSLLLLPFILKVFLGALSDRVPMGQWGSRKPYMVVGLFLFSLCYLALAKIAQPAEHFFIFATVTWFASLGLALFDTCCDGWAIDIAKENEESPIQAAMVAGRALGFVSMSLAFAGLAHTYGFRIVYAALSGMAVLVVVLVSLTRYSGEKKSLSRESGFNWRELKAAGIFLFAIYGVIYSIPQFGIDGLLTLFLSEVGKTSTSGLGVYGTFRGLGALLGAGVGVFALRRWGLKGSALRSLVVLGSGCLVPLLGLPVPAIGVLWGICCGLQETVFLSVAMHFSRGKWPATFFAGAMILSNLGTAVGEGLAAPLAGHYGYQMVFIVFALLAWALLPVVAAWRIKK